MNTCHSAAQMTESKSTSRTASNKTEITLGLLNAVHKNNAVTQRSVARELGIALGLANAYLKRCVKKGLIKVSQAPANRYAYYLTPKGFTEKSRLTAEYLSSSFGFFRKARNQCSEFFDTCVSLHRDRIVLAGVGDLCEIATLFVREYPITIVGIIDGKTSLSSFAGLPVRKRLADFEEVDAILVTDLENPQATFDSLIRELPPEKVMTPRLLKVFQETPEHAEKGKAA